MPPYAAPATPGPLARVAPGGAPTDASCDRAPSPPSERVARGEVRVGVMGTSAHVVLRDAERATIGRLVAALRSLEQRWSRFRPSSELNRLNASAGSWTVVGPDTATLVASALEGWRRSGGRFDPTVLHALERAGYDRSFEELPAVCDAGAPEPTPGCAGIELAAAANLVRLPEGVALDAGGIAKGLAADLVAQEAIDRGARSALVSVGGDLRVAGEPPAEGWEVELDHQLAPAARVNLHAGAVATSSTLRRRWATVAGSAHHVIDPRSGRPTDSGAVACSVVAAEAWWAEVAATTILVGWADPELAGELDALLGDGAALVTLADGSQLTVGRSADAFSLAGPAGGTDTEEVP